MRCLRLAMRERVVEVALWQSNWAVPWPVTTARTSSLMLHRMAKNVRKCPKVSEAEIRLNCAAQWRLRRIVMMSHYVPLSVPLANAHREQNTRSRVKIAIVCAIVRESGHGASVWEEASSLPAFGFGDDRPVDCQLDHAAGGEDQQQAQKCNRRAAEEDETDAEKAEIRFFSASISVFSAARRLHSTVSAKKAADLLSPATNPPLS